MKSPTVALSAFAFKLFFIFESKARICCLRLFIAPGVALAGPSLFKFFGTAISTPQKSGRSVSRAPSRNQTNSLLPQLYQSGFLRPRTLLSKLVNLQRR